MDYDSMPAGREMDALVAEKVMGFTKKHLHYSDGDYAGWVYEDEHGERGNCEADRNKFSSSNSATRSVWEKIKEMDAGTQERFVEEIEAWAYDYDRTVAMIRSGRGHYPDTLLKMMFPAPEAICRAALKAVESAK